MKARLILPGLIALVLAGLATFFVLWNGNRASQPVVGAASQIVPHAAADAPASLETPPASEHAGKESDAVVTRRDANAPAAATH